MCVGIESKLNTTKLTLINKLMAFCKLRKISYKQLQFNPQFWGTCKVQNEIETKRNIPKGNEIYRNEMKPTETKQNQMKSSKMKYINHYDLKYI